MGRTARVSWREVASDLECWSARAPAAVLWDHVSSGLVQTRIHLLGDLERLSRLEKTATSIEKWNEAAVARIESVRRSKCTPDTGIRSGSSSMPILAFHIDHGILLIRTNTYREYLKLNVPRHDIDDTLQQIYHVGCKIMRLFVQDPSLVALSSGRHNMQFVMISHAATEVIRCSRLSDDAKEQAATLVRNLAEHVSKIANGLPSTSWASLYLEYMLFLVRKLSIKANGTSQVSPFNEDLFNSPGEGTTTRASASELESRIVGRQYDNPMPLPNIWDMDGADVFSMNEVTFLSGVVGGGNSLELDVPQVSMFDGVRW
ncbi:hypothetical protein Neosp_002985 [[Neocosmospora] mangrovei]